MKIILSPEEKLELEFLHSKQKDSRKADRIKSVLLRSEGWHLSKIAQAMRIHNDTVTSYLKEYSSTGSFNFKYQGSSERLSPTQSFKLQAHLEKNLYEKVIEIIAYVKITFEVSYTISGMTDWLNRNGFSYKLPKGEPSKANADKQLEFIAKYEKLKSDALDNEPIVFIDGVHPTMQSKSACGWIKKGTEKIIPTTASRTRLNIMGSIELSTMKTVTKDYMTINSRSVIEFFAELKGTYTNAHQIHVILDQAGYHRSNEVIKFSEKNNIMLHYLPPYSPNLNPIERLWKVMNEQVRNNRFFKTAKEFRGTIRFFFREKLPKISLNLRSRINDNFHVIKVEK